MPMHLPDAPEPHSPWVPAPGAGGLSELMMGDGRLAPADLESQRRQLLERDNAHGGGGPTPQHCGSADGQCRGAGAMSVKQERLIHHFAALTGQSVRTVRVVRVSVPKCKVPGLDTPARHAPQLSLSASFAILLTILDLTIFALLYAALLGLGPW